MFKHFAKDKVNDVVNSLNFLKKQEAKGTFEFLANYSLNELVSDDYHTYMSGHLVGDFTTSQEEINFTFSGNGRALTSSEIENMNKVLDISRINGELLSRLTLRIGGLLIYDRGYVENLATNQQIIDLLGYPISEVRAIMDDEILFVVLSDLVTPQMRFWVEIGSEEFANATDNTVEVTIQGDFTSTLNSPHVNGFEELEFAMHVQSDVEYLVPYRNEINNIYYNIDTQEWVDEFVVDESVGDLGFSKFFRHNIRADGTFGGIETMETDLAEHYDNGVLVSATQYIKKRRYPVLPQNYQGQITIRVYRASDGYLLGSASPSERIWQGQCHFTFDLPLDEPMYNGMPPEFGVRINTRVWIYSEALAAMAFVTLGLHKQAKDTLTRLALEQYKPNNTPDNNYLGAWPFSFDAYFGHIPEQDYLRNGGIAYVVWAFLVYRSITKDTSFDYNLNLALEYLLKEQILDTWDNRYGFIPLGWNFYDAESYELLYRRMTPCAIEHNLDYWQVMRLAYTEFGDRRYRNAAQLCQNTFNRVLRSDKRSFVQGLLFDGIDDSKALDANTWGGLFLVSTQQWHLIDGFIDFAEETYRLEKNIQINMDPAFLNSWYSNSTMLQGYKPYDYPRPDNPETIWSEGTLGGITLLWRTGKKKHNDIGNHYNNHTIHEMKYNSGSFDNGILSTTEAHRGMPWEFAMHASVTNNAWYIINIAKKDALWTPITKTFRL